jgi:hypothetical protein
MYRSSSCNRRRLRSPHDVERDGLMRVAAKALHFEIAIPGIEGIAQCRQWLRWTLEAEHPLILRLAGEPIGDLPGFRRPLCRGPHRSAVDRLA